MAAPITDTTPRFRCPQCKQIYRVKNADPIKRYSCKNCKVTLELVNEAAETVAVDPARVDARARAAQPTMIESPSLELMRPGHNSGPQSAPLLLKGERGDVSNAPTMGALDDLSLESTDGKKAHAADLMTLLPDSFDGYRVIKEIARGGMGAVLLAEQSDLRRKVAMKIMLPWAGTDDPAMQQRFMREARAMAKLRHPHIIEVYDVGSVSGMSYLSMEFIEGKTLSDCIIDDTLSFAQYAAVTSKVARALGYAHSKGIIHRDIKPANIMLRASGEPVIMDFGLAKDFTSESVKLSMTGNIMGTPSYMSPEQAQGLQVDERSDLYSLGAVLYEAVTRQVPFEGETTIATIYNVVHRDATPAHMVRKEVPISLSNICAKTLEKNPDDRYKSTSEFAADLDRFSEGMEIRAQGKTLTRKAMDWQRTHRTARGALLAAVTAIVVAFAVVKMGWLRTGKTKADELRAALTTGSTETRLLHVKALGGDLRDQKIQSGTPEAEDVLAALRQAAIDTDPNGEVAAAALLALSESGDKKSEQTLVAQLDPSRPVNVRRAAVNALAKLKPQGLTSYLMEAIKNDPALEIRLAALEGLPDVAPPDLMMYLLQLSVKGEPPAIAAAANRKLSQLRPAQSILASYTGGASVRVAQDVAKVINLSKDYNQQLEDALDEGKSRTGTGKKENPKPQPYERAAQRLLSADKGERLQAAYDLGILADSRAEMVLVRTIQDSDEDVALTAAEALGKLPKIEGPEKIAGLLKSPLPTLRRAAARACGLARPSPPGAPLADALLTEKSGPVQAELASAIGRMKFAGGVTALSTLLSQGSPQAALRSAWALGQVGDKSAAPALLEALSRAGNNAELKEEIAAALSALTGKTIGPDEAKWREALKK